MRILKFIVEGQSIKPDPDCDFSGLVPGTNGYLQAEFAFSPEWASCVKVASFYSAMGKEYTPKVLNQNTCSIPIEALAKREFQVRIIGKCKDYTITTNKLAVRQTGG